MVPHLNTCCIWNLLSLKNFGESKCSGYLNSLWNYSQTHNSDVRWWTSKFTLGYRQPERRGYNTSFPVSLSNMFYTKPGKKITFFGTIFVVFALSNELDGEYIEANCFSNVKLYICGSYSFSNKQERCSFLKWFFLWVIQSFMSLNIAQKFVMHWYFVCVYWSEMLCGFLYLPPIHECRYAWFVYMNLDVEFLKKV